MVVNLTTRENFEIWYAGYEGGGPAGKVVIDPKISSKIDQLIAPVSQAIEGFLGRSVERTTYTEELPVRGFGRRFFLKHTPITSVTAIKNSKLWEFTAVNAIESTEWRVDSATGIIHVATHVNLEQGELALQVEYIGGLIANVSEVIDPTNEYHALNLACNMQIDYMISRRNSMGSETQSRSGGASVTKTKEIALLKMVEQIISPFRRVRLHA